MNAAGYRRSVSMKYTEEALAQGYAEMRGGGLATGVLKGIAFPVRFGYVTVAEMGVEAGAIATIIVGGQRLAVIARTPFWATDVPYLKTDIEKIYGWWWNNANGGLYSYCFVPNGTVRWFGVYNHMNDHGKWA